MSANFAEHRHLQQRPTEGLRCDSDGLDDRDRQDGEPDDHVDRQGEHDRRADEQVRTDYVAAVTPPRNTSAGESLSVHPMWTAVTPAQWLSATTLPISASLSAVMSETVEPNLANQTVTLPYQPFRSAVPVINGDELLIAESITQLCGGPATAPPPQLGTEQHDEQHAGAERDPGTDAVVRHRI